MKNDLGNSLLTSKLRKRGYFGRKFPSVFLAFSNVTPIWMKPRDLGGKNIFPNRDRKREEKL